MLTVALKSNVSRKSRYMWTAYLIKIPDANLELPWSQGLHKQSIAMERNQALIYETNMPSVALNTVPGLSRQMSTAYLKSQMPRLSWLLLKVCTST